MPLLYVVGVLCLAAFLIWAICKCPFFDADMKAGIKWLIIIVAGVWVLSLFFPIGHLAELRVGH